jgi:hypothetical protein
LIPAKYRQQSNEYLPIAVISPEHAAHAACLIVLHLKTTVTPSAKKQAFMLF